MLEIVMLGTGCGIPTRGRNHSSIWLRYEGESFLWDCGEGTQRQLLKADINFMKIDRIFITHWHADHWAGLIGLIQTMNLEKRRRPLYIYGPDAERFVGDIMDLDYWGPRFNIIPKDVPSVGDDISVVLKTKDYNITSTPVCHTVPAVGYSFQENDRINIDLKKAKSFGLKQSPMLGKLKTKGKIDYKGKTIILDDVSEVTKGIKVAYSGDTKPCKNLVKLSKGADVLIHDTTFVEDQENRMHTGAKDAAKVAKEAKVRNLVMTHFSRRYQDLRPIENEAKTIFKNSIIAMDFMRFNIKSGGELECIKPFRK